MSYSKENRIPLISIVIPVYNSLNIIDKCLESLESQTSRNFEVIFIDDCSKGNNYEELKKKLNNYSFVYQIHQNIKNSGPGFTRNNGIKLSKGSYIVFIDSDDYVSSNFIEIIEKNIDEESPDVIIFDYYIEKNNKLNKTDGLPLKQGRISKLDALALSKGACWGKVYKKNIIIENSIEFPNLIRSEDLAFCKAFISKCDRIYYLKEYLYYYIENKHSIMHTMSTMNISNNIKAFEYIRKNTENNEAIEMIFIREYLYLIVQIMILKNNSTKEIKKFISQCNNEYNKWYKNKYIKFQPTYMRLILILIRRRIILPIRIIFKLKNQEI